VIRNGKTNITHKKLGFNLTFYFQIQFIEKLYNEHEVTMFKIRIRISHTKRIPISSSSIEMSRSSATLQLRDEIERKCGVTLRLRL
jgi:hypothetical protein